MEQSIADASERECFVFSFYYSPLHALHFLLYLGIPVSHFIVLFCVFSDMGNASLVCSCSAKKVVLITSCLHFEDKISVCGS